MSRSTQPPSARFERFVLPTDTCWLWVGKSTARGGYGVFFDGEKAVRAHRFAYEMARGEIPVGMCVLHQCDNPRCVRPDHLFLGSQADNMDDMWEKRRGAGQRPDSWYLGRA